MEMKKRIIKRIAIAALPLIMGTTLSSCTSVEKKSEENTVSVEQTTETSESTTEISTVETKTEEKEIETPKEEVKSGKLNVYDDASVEETVEEFYEENKEYIERNGISKDQIRDIIYVLNDRFTEDKNNNGKAIIDETSSDWAYAIINTMLYSDELIQKMDNIITTEVSGYDTNNDWVITKHPSLIPLIDENLAGSSIVISELTEYEALRDYEIDYMNENNKIDVDKIDQYIIKNEVTDINRNSNAISSVQGIGQQYTMAAMHYAALNMDAKVNTDVIFLQVPQYDNIPAIKINATNAERDLESLYISLMESRGEDEIDLYNNVVTDVQTLVKAKKTSEEIAKYIEMKYSDIKIDDSNLIIRYYMFRETMAIEQYDNIMCSTYGRVHNLFEDLKQRNLYNKNKTLTLTC